MSNTFFEKHNVISYEGDRLENMTIPMIVSRMLVTSTNQSEMLGVGQEFLTQNNVSWVVTQHVLEVYKLPKIGSNIKVGTEIAGYNSYFLRKSFVILDDNDNCLVKMDTIFVLIDKELRRMKRIDDNFLKPYEIFKSNTNFLLDKLKSFETDIISNQFYKVRYFDIDRNGHVNNAKYIEWMMGNLSDSFLLSKYPRYLNIRYHKEVMPGHDVSSTAFVDNKKTYHQINLNDKLCCEAEFKWEYYK